MATTTTVIRPTVAARVLALAEEYVKDVKARRAFGDFRPEYHAQKPKVEAYKLLLDEGLSSRKAVAYFRHVLTLIGEEVTL